MKNAMKAKFEKILVPIADELINPEQRKHVTFDAFFANTMFHEVAHGLGIKNTIDGKGTVRMALKEHYSALEEGKADMIVAAMKEHVPEAEVNIKVVKERVRSRIHDMPYKKLPRNFKRELVLCCVSTGEIKGRGLAGYHKDRGKIITSLPSVLGSRLTATLRHPR